MVRRYGPFAQRNPWRRIAVQVCAGLTAGTVLFGFFVLPIAGRTRGQTAWGAICSAFGSKQATRAARQAAPVYASMVRWDVHELAQVAAGDAQRGKLVAENCQACHGADGINGSRWIPNLAGLRAETTVKQLLDYKSGHRRWPVMNAIGAALSRGAILDVAAYYASLKPAGAVAADWGAEAVSAGATPDIRRLIFAGDPSRGIAPCASCHGMGGLKTGAPVLAGEQAAYVERQLDAFQTRSRANDEGEQMRVVASRLRPDEIGKLAAFLALHDVPCDTAGTQCRH